MAMSGRLYSVPFQAVTLAAAQDLVAIYAGATKIVAVHSLNIGQVTGVTVANFRVRLRRLLATVTPGSGGSTPTPTPLVPGDAAATFTAHANDTTQATSSSAADVWDDVWNTINGFLWVNPVPNRPLIIPLSGAFIFSLDQVPSSLVANGTAICEELP